MRGHLVYWYQRLRILKYRFLSDCQRVEGKPILRQPVQMVGAGKIVFHGPVNLGCYPSPFALTGCIYLEVRNPDSLIEIGADVWVNNNSVLISNGPGIVIGARTMIGTHCEILDSDFHNIHPDKRLDPKAVRSAKVIIGENVLIGSNARILKGVKIGDNSVIANGTVVNRTIPANMLAFGNPVRCGRLFDTALWDVQKGPQIPGARDSAA